MLTPTHVLSSILFIVSMKKTEAGRKSTSVFPLLALSAFQSMFLPLKIAAEGFDSRYTLHKTGSVQGFTSVGTAKHNLV